MFSPPRYLGFDLSERALKVVVLESQGTKKLPRLVGWHIHDLPPNLLAAGSLKNPALLRQEIFRALRRAPGHPLAVRYLIAALPEITTFLRAVPLPTHEPLSPEITARELERNIPLTQEEAYFSAEPFSLPGGTGILLAAAPKKVVNEFVTFFEQAGWIPLALETEAQAIVRATVTPDTNDLVGILDLGATRTQLVIACGETPLLSATLPFAGEPIISRLGELMQWDRSQVLQHLTNCEQNAAECPNEWRKVFDEFASAVTQGVQQLLTPLTDSNTFITTIPTRFLICGGMSILPGLVEMLTKDLGVPTILANPLDKLQLATKLKPTTTEQGRLAVAIGLALRGTGVVIPPPTSSKKKFTWPWQKKVKKEPISVPAPETASPATTMGHAS